MDKEISEISTHIHKKIQFLEKKTPWKWNRPSRRTKMSVKAAIRPSALPLPKTTSSQSLSSYDRKCMLPVAVDRNRRAGSDPRASGGAHPSTPTRGSATSIVRSSSIRSTASNQDKRVIKESNKENSKAKEPAFNRSKIIVHNNNNINTSKTKG